MIFQLHSHATVFSQLKIPLPQKINTTLPLNMADGSKIINKIMPHTNKHRRTVKPWEVLLGILGGSVPPSSPNLPLFQTKKCYSKGRNYVIITKIRAQSNEHFVKREIDYIIKLSFVLIFKKRYSSVLFHYRVFTPLFSRTIVRSLNPLHS